LGDKSQRKVVAAQLLELRVALRLYLGRESTYRFTAEKRSESAVAVFG